MPTVTVPDDHAAVVILIPKADGDNDIKIRIVNGEEGADHLLAADAIAALAGSLADEIDELGEPDDEDDGGDVDDNEPDEP